jgi:amino acid transporter
MDLVSLVLMLAVVGLFCWLIVTYIPMPAPFQKIIIAVVVIAVILYLLSYFGVYDFPIRHHGR